MSSDTVQFINNLPASVAEQPPHTHSHDGGPAHSHDHGGEHGHTHEHLDNPGKQRKYLLIS
jgi:urease accessory protein